MSLIAQMTKATAGLVPANENFFLNAEAQSRIANRHNGRLVGHNDETC